MSEPLAEYVRHHRCYNADPNVSIADWDRGILAIEAEAREQAEQEVKRLREALVDFADTEANEQRRGKMRAALASTEEARHVSESDLPARVVVDQHGHYWRDYGEHWSMCPVSEENISTEPVAVYERVPDPTLHDRLLSLACDR